MQQIRPQLVRAEARAAAARRRSEVDRRLDLCVAGRDRRLRQEAIPDFVRLFNMCDIGPPAKEDDPRAANAMVRFDFVRVFCAAARLLAYCCCCCVVCHLMVCKSG